MRAAGHPHEPGKWTLLDSAGAAALWRRDRSDPVPVTMFYVVRPPRQTEVVYSETQARALFDAAAARPASD